MELAFPLLLLCYAELIVRDDTWAGATERKSDGDLDGHAASLGLQVSELRPTIVARSMIERARRCVAEWGAGASPYHADILAALAALTDPQAQLWGG